MSEGAAEGAVFRTAATPTTETNAPGAPATTGSHVSESTLFATYEDEAKRPYVADYYEVPNIWKEEAGMERDLREIEGYVRSQVEAKKVANSTKAASAFLKELERGAGLTRYESTPQRITKMLAYIDFKKVVDG